MEVHPIDYFVSIPQRFDYKKNKTITDKENAEFQFLKGSIISLHRKPCFSHSTWFQFLKGSIIRIVFSLFVYWFLKFQFLKGSIIRFTAEPLANDSIGFNSSKVRL